MDKYKCIHNKRKYVCVLCGGSRICKHKKRKYDCVECKGSGICKHNTRKRSCKICKFCEHKKIINKCNICNIFKKFDMNFSEPEKNIFEQIGDILLDQLTS